MSLPILVFVVVIGIAAIVLAVHFAGGSARRAMQNPAEARDAFAADFPDATVMQVWLTIDGGTAVLRLAGGRIGLVHAVGIRHLTRTIGEKDIASMELRENAAISIRFRDFTFPRATLRFTDLATARAALDALTNAS